MYKHLVYIQAVLYHFLNMFGLYTAFFAYESAILVSSITGGGEDE